jgi:hypothetical protein
MTTVSNTTVPTTRTITLSDLDASFNATFNRYNNTYSEYSKYLTTYNPSSKRTPNDFKGIVGYTYGSSTELFMGATGQNGPTLSMSKSSCIDSCIGATGCIGATFMLESTDDINSKGFCLLNTTQELLVETPLIPNNIALISTTQYYYNQLAALNVILQSINNQYQELYNSSNSLTITRKNNTKIKTLDDQLQQINKNNEQLKELSNKILTKSQIFNDSLLVLTEEHIKYYSTFLVMFIIFIIFKMLYFPSIIVDSILIFLAIILLMFIVVQIRL